MPTNTKQQLCIKPTGFLVEYCVNLLFIKKRQDIAYNLNIKHVIFLYPFKNKKLIVTNISVISYSYATHQNTIMQRT